MGAVVRVDAGASGATGIARGAGLGVAAGAGVEVKQDWA